jgi:hypothetical protein
MAHGIHLRIIESTQFAKFVQQSLTRHATRDWGEVCPDDWKQNDLSLEQGFRIFSAYHNGTEKIWIITEADRSTTTILFPDEY